MKYHVDCLKYLVKIKSNLNSTNAEKNSIDIQEYKKIVAKIEVKLVTKKRQKETKILKK